MNPRHFDPNQANANPEREAYIQKYALEKLREEYEGYKKQVEDGELKTSQELRRLQENLAGRSLADEAAKQVLRPCMPLSLETLCSRFEAGAGEVPKKQALGPRTSKPGPQTQNVNFYSDGVAEK